MILLLALILAILLALPWFFEEKRVRIHREERENAPGEFVILSGGVTHYRWFGPTRGPIILAVHGLTTPSDVFVALAERLGRLGYRVLALDLYGRGYSDGANENHTLALYHRQIDELLAALKIERSVILMGYSMGGSIVTSYAASRLERVDQVILLASAGIEVNESAFSRFCRRTPYFGDWLFAVWGPKRMTDDILADRRVHDVPNIQEVQLAQLDRRGFVRAVLSSRRHALDVTLEHDHRKLGRRRVPVVALWGEEDAVIPLSASDRLASWNPAAKQAIILGADHSLPYSHAEIAASRIRPHLMKKD